MKAYKETIRKYYKYSYTSWTRPNISSNGTLGGNSFACSGGVSNPWQCFDGNSGTMGQFYATSENYKTLIFYNPTPIKIYSVGFTYYPSAYIKQATFYGSNDNSTWTEITSFTNSANSNTVNFPSDVNAYKYYKLYITSANGHDGWGGYYIADIYELTINAQQQTIVESTSSDYDFYEDIGDYSLYAEKVYYKYTYNSWTQPVLSSNGVIGGNSFAVTASSYFDNPRQPFNAFDGQNAEESNCWHAASGYPQWIEWYNPVALKYSNVKILNRTNYGNAIKNYQVQISNDGNSWETILTGTNTVSAANTEWNINLSSIQPITKYVRIYITSGYDSNYVVIGEITITAQEQDITSGTSSDYDFYRYAYKAFNI